MNKSRRKHSPEYKAKVVLELLSGTGTVSEIASKYEVHPTMIVKWRRTFLERSWEIFSEKGSIEGKEKAEIETELYKKIGQLQMELDWFKKKSIQYH